MNPILRQINPVHTLMIATLILTPSTSLLSCICPTLGHLALLLRPVRSRSRFMGEGRVTSPAPVIKCDLRASVQCDMEFPLQLFHCVLVILAARSAVCVENCELYNNIDNAFSRNLTLFILHGADQLGRNAIYCWPVFQCHFVHHKSAWTDLGANPDLRGEKLAKNRLNYDTAMNVIYYKLQKFIFKMKIL